MRLVVDGDPLEGRAIDAEVEPARLVQAVRDGTAPDLRVDAPTPGPGHGPLSVVPARDRSSRVLVAAAARSRGHAAPQDRELAAVERRLRELTVPDVDLAAARRRVAEAGESRAELRERVATLRGRLSARRETGAPTGEVEAAIADATRRLSEVETERVAAEEALAAARERAREAREVRERRLRLQDRAANLRRAARAHLAAEVDDAVRAALARVPGEAWPADSPGQFEGDPVGVNLAAVRVADLDAPVVCVCDRFDSAAEAAAVVEAPVVRPCVETG